MNDRMDDEFDYVNVDDYKLSNALVALRGTVERELIRHSWIERKSLVPAGLFGGMTCRAIVTACDGRWGDYALCRMVLSGEMYSELVRIIVDLPCRDFDWCMRAMSLCLSATKEDAIAFLSVAKAARKGRRRAA